MFTVAFLRARGQQTSESPRQGSGDVHAARERSCDITVSMIVFVLSLSGDF